MYYFGRLRSKVLQEEPHMSNNGYHPTEFTSEPVTIREAERADVPALRRLAQRDSASMIERPAIVALREGEPRAALSMRNGAVIADPFHRTAELVELLEAHARALDHSIRRASIRPRAERRGGRHQAVARLRRAV
jgi:hypothetical protein